VRVIRSSRERRCPSCRGRIRDRDARWCGACGAALATPAADLRHPEARAAGPRGDVRRHFLVVGVVVGALALLGAFVVERPSGTTTSVRDDAVVAPEETTLPDTRRPSSVPVSQVDGPTCGDGTEDCFLWVAGLDDATSDVVVGGRWVVEQAGETIAARRRHDGAVAWRLRVRDAVAGTLVVTEDLLLHRVGDALVGRTLVGGGARWRVALGDVAAVEVHDGGEALVVVAELPPTSDSGDPGLRGVAAGIDARTGAVRWREEGRRAALAADGVAIVTAEDGHVVAIEPDGRVRWRVDAGLERARDGHALAFGHAVYVFPGGGHAPGLRALASGDPLEVTGGGVVSDDRHTLLVRSVGDMIEHVLVDEDGEIWRSQSLSFTGCYGAARLEPDVVVIETCDGARLALDRADGSEVSRTPAPTARPYAPEDGFAVGWIGPYQLRDTDPLGDVGDLLVVDTRDDADLARFPPGTRPVTADARDRPVVHDGVVVFRGSDWLAALEVPDPPG
jgi:outer membrane protein assembly factor BamB